MRFLGQNKFSLFHLSKTCLRQEIQENEGGKGIGNSGEEFKGQDYFIAFRQ